MKKLIIFSDFDGTFTAKDIGNRIFTHFSNGRNIPLVDDWKKGLITSRECLLKEAELVSVSPTEFYSFLEGFELSPGAIELYALAQKKNVPFIILSDGLDLYIEHILRKYNLPIPSFSNRGYLENGGLRFEFPYDNNGCERCGSCKGERIKEFILKHNIERTQSQILYVGDGLSDICALPESDIIFARGDLLNYCHINGFSAIEYQNFFDILKWLQNAGLTAG